MDANFTDAFGVGSFDQTFEVVEVTMNTTVGKDTGEMQSARTDVFIIPYISRIVNSNRGGSEAIDDIVPSLRLKYFASSEGFVDTGDTLLNSATGTHGVVTDFGISHNARK